MGAAEIQAEIAELADPVTAAGQTRFFKAGPGEYGEGDRFVGVRVPPLRKIARAHRELALDEISELLSSPIHEHRSTALFILTEQAKRAQGEHLREIYDFYLAHSDRINNWDLVDISCRDIVGGYLLETGDWSPLFELARSQVLWERRIAMVSTWTFIREGDLEPTFVLAERLLDDGEDLMHKAVGWMLREAGKKDETALEDFLSRHAPEMPRTALRYAIERMPPERRAYWREYR